MEATLRFKYLLAEFLRDEVLQVIYQLLSNDVCWIIHFHLNMFLYGNYIFAYIYLGKAYFENWIGIYVDQLKYEH